MMMVYDICLTLFFFSLIEASVTCDQFTYPELLEPLSAELQTRILDLADKLEIKQQLCSFFITPERLNSPASVWQSLSQAWLNDSAYLLIQRKKFAKFTDEEQLFILYHELSHIKRNHTRSKYLWRFLKYTATFLGGYSAYKLSSQQKNHLSLKLASAATGAYTAWFITCLISYKKARDQELQADQDALEWQKNKEAAISTLKKTIHFSPRSQHFLGRLFEYHPSIEERIRNLSLRS